MTASQQAEKPAPHERLVPFRGNWNLPWVIQRYWKTSRSGFTPAKFLNAMMAMVEMRCGRTRVRSKPSVLRIEPTNVCNLKCPRCSCGIGTDPRPKGFIDLGGYREILEQNRRNAVIVRLDGNGEPTLHSSIFDMIAMAKDHGYAVSMSTNLNTDRSADSEAFIDSGLDRLIAAIDGSTQATYEKYRVGGSLALAEERLTALLDARKRRGGRTPFVEVQFLDWGYNHDDIPELRAKVGKWGADKFEVISPDWASTAAKAAPDRPRRCFWLWCVLSVSWQLEYRSCTNAWTLPWPKMGLMDVPTAEFWNHELMIEARRYNIDKSSQTIASDKGCNCNNCSDMLVVDRPPGYVCQ